MISMIRKLKLFIIVGSVLLVGSFIVTYTLQHINNSPTTTQQIQIPIGDGGFVTFETSYAQVPIEQQIDQADVILIGVIADISATQWNQDSNEYWEEVVKGTDPENGDPIEYIDSALPFYTIKLTVKSSIVSDEKPGENVEVTVVGVSPIGDSEYPIRVGDETVVFAKRSQLEWREGKRPILMFMGSPETSQFWLGEDGLYHTQNQKEEPITLEQLVSRIEKRRPVNTIE
jgi:hypothetical protein